MPIAETEKSLRPIRRKSTQLQIELRLYPIPSVWISLFGGYQISLQHLGQVLDIHAGLVSTYLLQPVLLGQLPQYLLAKSDMDTDVELQLECRLLVPCACFG